MTIESRDLEISTEADSVPHAAKLFESLAQSGGEAISRLEDSVRAPNRNKSLREFTPVEAAEWLSMTPAYLRKLHADGVISEVERAANNQRRYRAEDIHKLRDEVYQKVKDSSKPGSAERYRSGRPSGTSVAVVVVANFKGGVGKTSTAAHLAAGAAMSGHRVLVIDADSQGSLTHLFDTVPQVSAEDEEDRDPTLYDVISTSRDVSVREAIYASYFPNIHVIPADLELEEFEFETPVEMMRGAGDAATPFYERIISLIEDVQDFYDLVIIDCPPRLSFLTIAAVSAATLCIVPCPPSMLDVVSTNKFLRMCASHVQTVATQGDEDVIAIRDVKILLTKVKSADINHAEVSNFMRRSYGDAVLASEFLESSAIVDAAKTGEVLIEVPKGSMNRKTHERASSSVRAVNDEILDLIKEQWRLERHGA